jgi:hypothetical protein
LIAALALAAYLTRQALLHTRPQQFYFPSCVTKILANVFS